MAKNNIRLQYTGLVVFVSRLISILTGMIFTIVITRNLSFEEFGTWTNIGDIFHYFTLIAGILPFWSQRFTARGRQEAFITGLVANFSISILMSGAYLLSIPILTTLLGINTIYLLVYELMAIQIIAVHMISVLESLIELRRPQAIGYGLIVFECFKLLASSFLIINDQINLLLIITIIIASHFVQMLFYLILVKNYFKGKIMWSYIKEWIKASPLNLYHIIGRRLLGIPLLLLFSFSGELARAYFGAAQTISNIIGYSSFISFALYPKMLMGGGSRDILVILKMVLMFATPMTVGVLVLSDSYLFMLNAPYVDAQPILFFLAIGAFFTIVSGVFSAATMGIDKLGESTDIPFRTLMKSKTFQLYSIDYLSSTIVVPLSYIVLSEYVYDPLQSAIFISAILMMSSIFRLILTRWITKTELTVHFPAKALGKYLLASLVMLAILSVISHPRLIREILPLTFFGAVVYFGVLYLLDKETRNLVRLVVKEIQNKLPLR